MLYTWQNIVLITLIISLVENVDIMHENTQSIDWRTVETIAEEVPYVVALLNQSKSYICTGVAISKDTVLTTGKCLSPDPKYVVIGQAVINDYVKKNKMLLIDYFVKHPDYTFKWERTAPDKTTIHSNIGIIYTVRQILHLHYEMAQVGTFYAPELHNRQFSAVGYGNANVHNTQVLDRRLYHQEACVNPKWYYCVCGYTADYIDFEQLFGEGGPVLVDTDVVAVITVPCGKLFKPDQLVSYNIFTIIGPYLTWMNRLRNKENVVKFSKESGSSAVKPFSMIKFVSLLITSKSFL